MRLLCPHFSQPTDSGTGTLGSVSGRPAVQEHRHGSFVQLEALEADALRLKLTNDRILEAQVREGEGRYLLGPALKGGRDGGIFELQVRGATSCVGWGRRSPYPV